MFDVTKYDAGIHTKGMYTTFVWILLHVCICHKYHVKYTPKQRKLDPWKSESKGATIEMPTYAVLVHAPQTNIL